MIRFMHVAAMLLCIILLRALSLGGQDKGAKNPPPKSKEQNLTMKTIGHGRMSTGVTAGFRVYAASDGTKASVWYADFHSINEADTEIATWLKPYQVSTREETKDQSGQAIGERIVAFVEHTNPNRKEFLLIRRSGPTGYFIRSESLAVARQVEGLIEPSSESAK